MQCVVLYIPRTVIGQVLDFIKPQASGEINLPEVFQITKPDSRA